MIVPHIISFVSLRVYLGCIFNMSTHFFTIRLSDREIGIIKHHLCSLGFLLYSKEMCVEDDDEKVI